ncbi:MAG TPA: alpha/beta hydrolase [Micromonosporaceae bacterium]|nr:alpha/beta hydrolase [Micromonosporaceae bacterium]
MRRTVVILLVTLVVLLVLAWLGQRRLVYLPDRSPAPPAADVLPGAQDVTLETSDGLRLGAWWVPPRAPPRGMAVLVAPGNGGNRAGRAPLAAALAGAGFAVLLFDYRGYGGNAGAPTAAGLARDARAAYRFLVDVAGVPAGRIIYFGESLGCGVVAELATEHRPGGLVLRSPFTDLAAVGAEHYPFLPVRLLLRDRYPVAEQVATVPVPTAVVYGTADSVVPPEQSRAVAERAAGPVQVTAVAGADHNDLALFAGPQVVDAVVALADLVAAGSD